MQLVFVAAPRRALMVLIVAWLWLVSPAVRAAAPDVYAVTNARIVSPGGATIAKGTIVLRDGLIEALGPNVVPPGDARVLDGTGLTVYPALIDALTVLGMPDAKEYPVARGDVYPVAAVRAEQSAIGLLKPDPAAFHARRQAGFGAALVVPRVGLLSGQSALITLGDAPEPAALVLKTPVAMHLRFNTKFSFDEDDEDRPYPDSLMGQVALARQALFDAQDAARRLESYEKNPTGQKRPTINRALVALRPVVEKTLPLVIDADTRNDILRALRLAREFGLRPVIEGGTEAYRVVAELKAANAVVLLSAALPEPPKAVPGEDERSTLSELRTRALALRSARALEEAGVPFALTTRGLARPSQFKTNVRKMIEAGLSPGAALLAATLAPARLLGVERQLGSLEVGKIANLVVTSGDLWDEKTKIRHLFVDGKKIDLAARPVSTARGTGGPGGPEASGPDEADEEANNPEADTDTTDSSQREDKKKPAAPAQPATPAKTAPPASVAQTGPAVPLPAPLPDTFVLRGAAFVWTVGPQGKLPNADVLVRNGKIADVGVRLVVPSGTREVDARGKHVTPGMIDCHSHTAIQGNVNECTNSVTAEVRIEDVIDADDINIYRQLAGGTTLANLLHGSCNAIGGQNAVVKWRWGQGPDALLFALAPPGIKFALGENPKQSNWNNPKPRYPQTRLGVEKTIRDAFLRARDYQRKQQAYHNGTEQLPPRRDLQLDALVEILQGKRRVHCHSYRQDEVLMMLRVAEEFGFRVATFQHVLEGYKVADELAAHGAGASTFSDWWAFKVEAYDAIPYNGALLTNRGVLTSFNSDSSELARRLHLEAAKAVHWGKLAPEEAIKLVTLNPAKQLGVDKYVGSVEPGKDADLAVWSGDPLATGTICLQTFVDGKLLFDRNADLAARPKLEAEKKALLAAEKAARDKGKSAAEKDKAKPAAKPTSTASAKDAKPGKASPAAKPGAGVVKAEVAVVQGAVAKPIPNGPVTAIVGGIVHPVSAPAIPGGVVLVRGGKIVAVGAQNNVPVPDGATRVDATGLHVYPGLLDADTRLGLTEIGAVRSTNDSREMGEFNPDLRAAIAVNPDSELIPVARANGVLVVATAPGGGTISGAGALLKLDGWTWEDMSLHQTLAMYLNFPFLGPRTARRPFALDDNCGHGGHSGHANTAQGHVFPAGAGDPAPEPAGDSKNAQRNDENVLRPLNTFLDDARRYQTARQAEAKAGVPPQRDPQLEALLPVLEGRMPLLIRANRAREIRSAVAWAKKEKLRIVLVGGREADKVAELLARENVPVVLGPVLDLPREDDAPYDEAYTLPARLRAAGVRFCLSTGDASDVRGLPYQAAMARAFGLSGDEALKAITLFPAQILGAGDRLGSLEPGKDANLILTTGDPLEITTDVTAAWIEGRPVDLSNKQLRLYEKYKGRPKRG